MAVQSDNNTTVNQINAQVKLLEMWKSSNVVSYPIKSNKQVPTSDARSTRATSRGDIVLSGHSAKSQSTFIHDAAKLWNYAPSIIKNATTILSAKR